MSKRRSGVGAGPRSLYPSTIPLSGFTISHFQWSWTVPEGRETGNSWDVLPLGVPGENEGRRDPKAGGPNCKTPSKWKVHGKFRGHPSNLGSSHSCPTL